MNTPLNDPALAGHYRQPRSVEELCREGHQRHMQMVDQAGWLRNQITLADERKRQDEQQLEQDLATFRRTGTMPAKSQGRRARGTKNRTSEGN